jgi:hypothetical protein
MVDHPVLLLIRKIEQHYPAQIKSFWKLSTRKKAAKLYKLIATAKNDAQLEKALLFKKLTAKTYSPKSDDLWRNEIRVLKAELERFIIDTEHELRLQEDENYNGWLLVQGFDRIKFKEGIAEKSQRLLNNKEFAGDYQFILDAEFVQLLNYMTGESDIKKLMEGFSQQVKNWETTLAEYIGQNLSKVNVLIAQYNWVSQQHQNPNIITPFTNEYRQHLPDTNISRYYSYYAQSFTGDFEAKIENYNTALKFIEPIAERNPLFASRRIVIKISLASELSGNGHFEKAHEIMTSIKSDVDTRFIDYKSVFYVNYVINLVKCQRYHEALAILDKELPDANELYKNMLLQSRLLCYLYLRDTQSLSTYISFDLDEAPFPQNYMLKLIKSAYFYLMKEYDLAAQMMTNLMNTKDAHNRMHLYQPIGNLYKKFYAVAVKNKGLKRWKQTDIALLNKELQKIETSETDWVKLVSVYVWLKGEIENIQAKSAA